MTAEFFKPIITKIKSRWPLAIWNVQIIYVSLNILKVTIKWQSCSKKNIEVRQPSRPIGIFSSHFYNCGYNGALESVVDVLTVHKGRHHLFPVFWPLPLRKNLIFLLNFTAGFYLKMEKKSRKTHKNCQGSFAPPNFVGKSDNPFPPSKAVCSIVVTSFMDGPKGQVYMSSTLLDEICFNSVLAIC